MLLVLVPATNHEIIGKAREFFEYAFEGFPYWSYVEFITDALNLQHDFGPLVSQFRRDVNVGKDMAWSTISSAMREGGLWRMRFR